MGSSWSREEEEDMSREFNEMRRQVRSLNNRLAVMEKNHTNVVVDLKRTARVSDKNRDEILNIQLLEEGRSSYRPRKTHLHSSYM